MKINGETGVPTMDEEEVSLLVEVARARAAARARTNEEIDRLCRQAKGLAPQVSEEAHDNFGQLTEARRAELGPRQIKAYELVRRAYELNATV